MILMWLGSFVLMVFGLTESQKYIGELLRNFQETVLNKGLDGSLKKILVRCLGLVLAEAAPVKALYSGMAFFNLRIVGVRSSALLMCLSTLGAWWALILGFLFLKVNGFFILGLCFFGFLYKGSSREIRLFFRWLFAVSLFLVGGEMTMRQANIVQTMLGQSDLAFALADGRFLSVMNILVVGALLTFLFEVEFWSLAFALALMLTNILSVNGALGLFAGERIGQMILFWWRTRGLNKDCQRLGQQFSMVSSISTIVGLFAVVELRNYFYIGLSNDVSFFQNRSFQFMVLVAFILGFQLVAQMIWGHFSSLVVADEIQEPKYFSVKNWRNSKLLSDTFMLWASTKIKQRLSEIRYHLQGLNAIKQGQIPETLQARLKEEEHQLSRLFSDLDQC